MQHIMQQGSHLISDLLSLQTHHICTGMLCLSLFKDVTFLNVKENISMIHFLFIS